MTPPEVRHARIALGMSQSKLGAALGVSARTVRAWEQGENKPHQNNIKALRRLLERHEAGGQDMADELTALQARIGDVSVAALRKGGEPLLEKVEGLLGIALRHSERVAAGVLPFAPDVARDMRASIERAEHAVSLYGEGAREGAPC